MIHKKVLIDSIGHESVSRAASSLMVQASIKLPMTSRPLARTFCHFIVGVPSGSEFTPCAAERIAVVRRCSLADLPAIALNNFPKSEKYWTRQRCEGAAGGEFVQQAVARSYLHEARIIGHRGASNICRPCSAVELRRIGASRTRQRNAEGHDLTV